MIYIYHTRASDLIRSSEACAISNSIIVYYVTRGADRAFGQLGFEELGKGSSDLWPFQSFFYSPELLGTIL